MPRNRTIYNSQALYVSEESSTDTIGFNNLNQLSRIQNFEEDFTRNFTDVNQLGNLGAIDRIEVENPDVTASFSYYLTDGLNEKKLGLNVYGSGTDFSELTSCISGLLTKVSDEKNYYLLIVEEGNDAAGYVGDLSGVIGIGNGFLTSYSVNVAVGEIPTADVEIEGLNVRIYGNITGNEIVPAINPVNGNSLTNTLFSVSKAKTITGGGIPNALQPGDIIFSLDSNDTLGFEGSDLKIQDFTLSFDLARTPLQKIGNRFAFSVTATLEVNAEVGDIRDGNLAELICSESEKEFRILMKEPGCGTDKKTALAFVFKGAKLVSQNFSSSIGDNATMSASYEVQLGGPQDTAKGIFISGSYDTNLIEQESNQILNFKFDKNNEFPYVTFNGNFNAGGPLNDDSRILVNYDHISPLLVEYNQQFDVLFGFRTFANRTFHEINSPYNILPLYHELQPRIIKMFGAGTRFGVPDSYYNVLVGDTNGNGLKTISSDPSTFTPSSGQSWVKYGVAQYVSIPSNATKVRFGVSYLVDSNDQFRLNNFGGITLSFKKDNIRSYNNVYAVHTTDFNEPNSSNFSDLSNLYNTGTYSNFDADFGQNAMCQWMGPNNSRVKVRRLTEFDDLVSNNKLDTFNTVNFTVDIPTFSTAGDEPDSANGFADAVSLEMFFAESVEYLNEDEENSGSIYFYKPFLYFE
jgi:hypothetical protein